ncbi:MAG: hypothetical protein B6D34_06995 [Candidatus Brocadia sp. UTAMX1]|nr:MAG: hypothetical protein B6D34_06995 [Candidatus Brocadia sp. UTAMX1]
MKPAPVAFHTLWTSKSAHTAAFVNGVVAPIHKERPGERCVTAMYTPLYLLFPEENHSGRTLTGF